MEEKVFNELFEIWKEGNIAWTKELAEKYDYVSGEALRSAFKRHRKRLGITKDSIALRVPSTVPVTGILDIETLPMVVYTFGMYDQNIGTEQVIREISLLSWAGKFLNSAEVYSDILTAEEIINDNEERIVTSCWRFLSKCDIVIGHSLINFDSKLMNTFFLKYNLAPLKYIPVDTLVVAKNNFRFSSNKLTFINQQLGIRDKIANDGFVLWRKCFEGDKEALGTMLEYNIGDIFATEDLFYKVRPYVRNINIALYNEILEKQCPVCGGLELTSEGFYYTPSGKWESFRCNNCKSLSRGKTNLLSTEKKRNILVNS